MLTKRELDRFMLIAEGHARAGRFECLRRLVDSAAKMAAERPNGRLDTPIAELTGLHPRVETLCYDTGITTVAEFLQTSKRELLEVPKWGDENYAEMLRALNRNGFTVKRAKARAKVSA